MNIGIRGHDLPCNSAQHLCEQLQQLEVKNIQLALTRSFPELTLCRDTVAEIAATLQKYDIHVSVLSCYIDPLSTAGQTQFLQFLEYATLFPDAIVATETATCCAQTLETEDNFQKLLVVAKQFAAAAAQHQVHFAFEAVKGMPLHDPLGMKRLIDAVNSPWLRLIFDPANLIDSTNTAMQQDIFAQVLETCAEQIAVIHYKAEPSIDYSVALNLAQENAAVTVITEGLCEEVLARELSKLKEYSAQPITAHL